MRVVSGEAMRYGLRQGDANGKRVRIYTAWADEVYIRGQLQYIFNCQCSIYSFFG